MNYSNMTTAALQSSTASISLPPISSIDFHTHLARIAHRSEAEVVQPLPPPPPAPQRVLPPLPYPYAARPAPPPVPPPPMHHEYMQARPIYPGIPSPYQPMPGRMPLPSTTDPSLIVAPTRHKAKEVKRRTKTGCLTCRKRRIKVSYDSCLLLFSCPCSLVQHCPTPSSSFSAPAIKRTTMDCSYNHFDSRRMARPGQRKSWARASLHEAPLRLVGDSRGWRLTPSPGERPPQEMQPF